MNKKNIILLLIALLLSSGNVSYAQEQMNTLTLDVDEKMTTIDESLSAWQVPATEELMSLLQYYSYEEKNEVRNILIEIISEFKEKIESLDRDFQTYEIRQRKEDTIDAKDKIAELLTELHVVNKRGWIDYLEKLQRVIQEIL